VISIQIQNGSLSVANQLFGDPSKVPDELLEVLGRAGANVLKLHFIGHEAKYPNKMGGRRQHFWLAVADSVARLAFAGLSVSIAITHPIIAHKVGVGPAGGMIVPKSKKWLAIPRIKEAYGLSPLSYANGGSQSRKLRFVKFSDTSAALIESLAGSKNKDGKKWQIVYSLRKSVKQKPQADALPTLEQYRPAMTEAAEAWMLANLGKA
jgi:hypothetical protein